MRNNFCGLSSTLHCFFNSELTGIKFSALSIGNNLVIRKNIIMKKRSFILLATALVFAACNNEGKDSVEKADSANESKMDTVHADTTTAATIAVDEATSDFMVKVADVGMTEVKLGQMAQDKAMSQRVKDFGSMMVKDHTAAGDELKSMASRKNVTLPSAVGEAHQKKIDALTKKTGKDFDRAYMDAMVDGHQSAINDFEKASNNTKDADIKSWADKTLPTLRMHLDSAKAIKKALR
jgi:putative membrane protein